MFRSSGGPHLRFGFSLKVYFRPSEEISGAASARSGKISLPAASAMCLVAISVRVSAPYRVNAIATYSPVGSKPLVKPKSLMAVRSTPPFWGVACCPLLPPPSSSPPPHAAATRARARASPTKRACCRLLPINPPCLLMILHLRWCLRAEQLPPSWRPACSPLCGTECVPEAVTHEVERQGGGEQEQAGEQHHPPGNGEDLPGGGVREHPSPGRGRLGHPDAQERQRRLEQDVGWDQQGRVDDDRCQQVGEQLL